MHNVIYDLCKLNGFEPIDIRRQAFKQQCSTPDWPASLIEFMGAQGQVYYGFRKLTGLTNIPKFSKAIKIFLVRDPRDVAVSFYFNVVKDGLSHPSVRFQADIPKSIDDFVISGRVDSIFDELLTYSEFIANDTNSICFKYEDIIFKKREWFAGLCKILDVTVSDSEMDTLVKFHDRIPEKENPTAHIRAVKPGNYKQHPGQKSIDYIQQKYDPIFEYFNYCKS
jgi:hypothetical protein